MPKNLERKQARAARHARFNEKFENYLSEHFDGLGDNKEIAQDDITGEFCIIGTTPGEIQFFDVTKLNIEGLSVFNTLYEWVERHEFFSEHVYNDVFYVAPNNQEEAIDFHGAEQWETVKGVGKYSIKDTWKHEHKFGSKNVDSEGLLTEWLTNVNTALNARLDFNDTKDQIRHNRKLMKSIMNEGGIRLDHAFYDYNMQHIMKAMYEFGDGAVVSYNHTDESHNKYLTNTHRWDDFTPTEWFDLNF